MKAVFGDKYESGELLTAGLVNEKNGRRYDAFRDRLMFPILPVEAPLAVVPVHGHTAAKVLHNDAAVLAAGHVDGIAVAVAGFIDRVGHDLKDRVGTALHTV